MRRRINKYIKFNKNNNLNGIRQLNYFYMQMIKKGNSGDIYIIYEYIRGEIDLQIDMMNELII